MHYIEIMKARKAGKDSSIWTSKTIRLNSPLTQIAERLTRIIAKSVSVTLVSIEVSHSGVHYRCSDTYRHQSKRDYHITTRVFTYLVLSTLTLK